MADLYDADPTSNQHWVDVLPSWPAQRLSGSQQTQDIDPMLGQWRASVADGGSSIAPALGQCIGSPWVAHTKWTH